MHTSCIQRQGVLQRNFHLPIFFHLQRLISSCWGRCLVLVTLCIVVRAIVLLVITVMITGIVFEGCRRSSCVRFLAITRLFFGICCGLRWCGWFSSYRRTRFRLVCVFITIVTVMVLVWLALPHAVAVVELTGRRRDPLPSLRVPPFCQ